MLIIFEVIAGELLLHETSSELSYQ